MKAYIITEEQKQALLKELELEFFKSKDTKAYFVNQESFQISDQLAEAMAHSIHRRFHYLVCKYLD